MTEPQSVEQQSRQILDRWIASCTRSGKVSRNTVAVGIVVLDHLRTVCPVERSQVISQGGEVKGARSALTGVRGAYGIPRSYLKEATSRQSPQDGQHLFEQLDWGRLLVPLPEKERDELLLELIDVLVSLAKDWLARKSMTLDIDQHDAPTRWVQTIVETARRRSGGVVEQHLVGAKLQRRFLSRSIPNYPAHAGDQQTARTGDFEIARLVYHVTAAPSRAVIQKCVANVKSGRHPILLVPSDQQQTAKVLAREDGIDHRITIMAIEDFLATNIIELATDEEKDFYDVLSEIIAIYNRRLAEVETDLSLQIQLR